MNSSGECKHSRPWQLLPWVLADDSHRTHANQFGKKTILSSLALTVWYLLNKQGASVPLFPVCSSNSQSRAKDTVIKKSRMFGWNHRIFSNWRQTVRSKNKAGVRKERLWCSLLNLAPCQESRWSWNLCDTME